MKQKTSILISSTLTVILIATLYFILKTLGLFSDFFGMIDFGIIIMGLGVIISVGISMFIYDLTSWSRLNTENPNKKVFKLSSTIAYLPAIIAGIIFFYLYIIIVSMVTYSLDSSDFIIKILAPIGLIISLVLTLYTFFGIKKALK